MSLYADFNQDGYNLINLEQHYQDVAFLVFKLLGCITQMEYKTAKGRIDAVVKTQDYIYIFEFKLNGTAKEAIDQISDREYDLPFRTDGRKLIKIGVSFSKKTHAPDNWIIES